MDPWAIIAILGGAFGVLLVGTWWLVLRRGEVYVGWRRKASLVSLVLPSAALVVLVAISTTAYFHPVNEMDDANLRGGWHLFVDVLWLSTYFTTGLLPICGFVSAMLGNGKPRLAGAAWSAMIFMIFLVTLILFANSFH
jgi:hypothetical protein